MKKLIFFLLLAAPALLHAQTNLGRTKSRWRQEKRADPTLAHLQALENAVAAQQQQIQQLTNELKQRDEQSVVVTLPARARFGRMDGRAGRIFFGVENES